MSFWRNSLDLILENKVSLQKLILTNIKEILKKIFRENEFP